MEDPYRSAPAPVVVERAKPFVRRRRWGRLAGSVLAMAAGPIGIAVYTAWVGFDWLGTTEERRQANARLRALPFPVAHDRPSALLEDRPRPIVAVTIDLEKALGDRDIDSWCQAAADLVPRLNIIPGDSTITLMSWPWRNQDLVLLAQLMDSWGRGLHAAHGIKSVDVRWAERSGPPASMI